MGAIITSLVPIFAALLGGASAAAAFSGLSVAQWALIAAALVNLAQPEITAEVAKLHPVFTQLVQYLEHGPPEQAAEQVAAFVQGFFHPTKKS